MVTIKQMIVAASLLAAVSGCGVQHTAKKLVGLGEPDRTLYKGPVYPATSTINIAFQPNQVDRSCRVFAETLVQTPPQFTGKDIEASILAEASKRGADQILIGLARESTNNNRLTFLYYGPTHEYPCDEQCGGWKYGYKLWEKQGEWVGLGYGQWGKESAVYAMPLTMQVAMLRCQ